MRPKINDTSENNENFDDINGQQVKRLLYHYEKLSSKKKIVDKVFLEDWKNGLNYKQVAQLDMKYYHDHSSLKHWKALKLCWENGLKKKEYRRTSELNSSLSTQLSPFFKTHLYIEGFEKNWWIRISIHDGVPPNVLPISANIIYVIYFTNSEHLLCSNIKREHKEFIMQGLLKTFMCDEIEEWDLKGKYVDSLEKLLLHRQSQGTYSRYRLNQVDDNPLSFPSKKLKIDDMPKNVDQLEDVMDEDEILLLKQRDTVVDDNFGPNEQPSLDVVEIKLSSPLHMSNNDQSIPLSTTVLFEGTNVIEGIKKMVMAGIAEPPLPAYLVDIHSNGKNYIEVDENNIVIH
ncbi:centromere protein Chl4/mis15/CENP-N [Glomus cerebriforme]|uniref:Centromere protein Chl4/mis15/CENP-N n=1 Tax=Glomus cerebriforme TaxID=658196 RepID=A0A397TL89_9GLOM|nr:centromere protein Chl4/mis15/CENP-N [Glomus cerebriforme]